MLQRVILSLAVLWMSMAVAYGRVYPFVRYTIAEGLPSNTIYEVYKDSKGFLWFSSDKGVGRFNGVKFEVFTTADGLADNEVFFCQEDKEGRIWFACYNGQLCYYKDGKFFNATNAPQLKLPINLPFIKVISVFSDSSVCITFHKDNHLVFFKHDKIITKQAKNLPAGRFITIVNKLNENQFSLYTDKFWKYQYDKSLEEVKLEDSVLSGAILVPGQNENYYLKDARLFNFNRAKIGDLNRAFLIDNLLYRILVSKAGQFLCSYNGLIYNNSTYILKGQRVSSICQDNLGNYWITTLDHGIFVLKSDFNNTSFQLDAYSGKAAFVAKKGDRIICGTSDSKIYEIDSLTSKLLVDLSYLGKSKVARNYENYVSGKGDTVFYFIDSLIVAIPNLNDIKPLIIRNKSFGDNVRMAQFANRNIYVKRGNYILESDCIHGMRSNSLSFNQLPDSLKNSDRIFNVCTDNAGNLWYSTLNKLYKLSAGKVYTIPSLGLKTFKFAGSKIIGISHFNQLMIVSNLNGKLIIDTISEQNCVWDKLHILDSNNIIVETNNNYRVLSLENNGKYSVHIIESKFVPLQPDAIFAEKGKCYFFKEGEITTIPLTTIYRKAKAPVVYFNILKTLNKEVQITDTIVIGYSESRQLSISLLTVTSGAKAVQYQYAISTGADLKWRDLNGDINMTYPQYGSYTVFVRAKTLSSPYSYPQSFFLIIEKPWWATTVFIVASGILILLVSIGLIRFRIKQIIRQRELKHQQDVRFLRSEYKALNALMNPHFIFNTLNDVQDLINKNDRRAANEYLRTFADLIRQNMHNVAKEVIPLPKELELVRNYLILEQLRFEEKLIYKLDIDELIDIEDVFVPPLLIQPLVENSIKHGIFPLVDRTGTVNVRVREVDDQIIISVEDNGIGMDASTGKVRDAHEPFGLENIRNRINQLSLIMGKEIKLVFSSETRNGVLWTIATVTLPV